MKLIKQLLDYLKFASTWKGIIGIVAAAGITFDAAQTEAIIAMALAAVGLIQVFVDDTKEEA